MNWDRSAWRNHDERLNIYKKIMHIPNDEKIREQSWRVSICGSEVHLYWLNRDDHNWMRSQLLRKSVSSAMNVFGI